MSEPGSRASELAAGQVEEIVRAAQEAADKIRAEAKHVRHEARRQGERDADEILEDARRESEAALHEARKQAIMLTQDARRDAEGILADANQEAERIREQTLRAVQGRVAAAEKAAADVLEEARALSGGLRQLGRSLEDQADRILRDVTAAHRQMQADLRVGHDPGLDRAEELPARATDRTAARLTPPRAATPHSRSEDAVPPPPRRPNPFEELEVPTWVAPD